MKTQTITIHDSDFGDAEVSLKFDDTGIPWVFAVQVGSFCVELDENIASQVFAQCALECAPQDDDEETEEERDDRLLVEEAEVRAEEGSRSAARFLRQRARR